MCSHDAVKFAWGFLSCAVCGCRLPMANPGEMRAKARGLEKAGLAGAANMAELAAKQMENSEKIGVL